MQVRNFVGKRVCLDEVKAMAGESRFYEAGDHDDTELAVAVLMLRDFECEMTDPSKGYDPIFVEEDRQAVICIAKSVGHVHMCGCQGMDSELRRFPHKTLEKEAEDLLKKMLSKR